jgi:hypothetical protein
LGWAQYQVRLNLAIRHHWQLVCYAFSFCWRASCADLLTPEAPPSGVAAKAHRLRPRRPESGEGGKENPEGLSRLAAVMASAEKREGVAGAVYDAAALLEGVLQQAPAEGVKSVA